MQPDLLDRKILYELELNARMPVTVIARRVRSSKETVNFRVNRLIGRGYVKSFYTVFNAARIGYYYYQTFMKFTGTTPDVERLIVEFIARDISCANLRMCEGPYDIVFMTMVKGPGGLREFFRRFKNEFGEYMLHQEIHSVVRTHKLNQKFFTAGEVEPVSFSQSDVDDAELDGMDQRIVERLSTNSRAKLTELARAVRADPKVLKYRLRKMENSGLIILYTIAPDFEKLGLERVHITIGIRNLNSLPTIIEFFRQTNACIWAFELLGRYDINVELAVENDAVLKSIVEMFKARFPDQYNYYDLVHIYRESVISWSPFESYSAKDAVKAAV